MYVYDMDGKLLWSKGPRRQEDAQPVRRRQHAGPRRRPPRHRLGSDLGGSFVVSLDASTDANCGASARRDRHLGDAARGRARRAAARRSCRG
jgi:hypothetical protein